MARALRVVPGAELRQTAALFRTPGLRARLFPWSFSSSRWLHVPRPEALCRADNPMPADVRRYWQTVLEDIQTPCAVRMRDRVDLSDVTGMPKYADKKPPCFDDYVSVKKAHPDKIVVIQVGDFYETCGHDAAILVGKWDIRPMGDEGAAPRAGFPVRNLDKMKKRIVGEMQLPLVVCNQYDRDDDSPPLNGYTKDRRVSEICTPGDHSYQDEDVFPSMTSASSVCLIYGPKGFSLAEFRLQQSAVRVTSGMTQDALWGQLLCRTVAAPICLHVSFTERVVDWKQQLRRVAPQVEKRLRVLKGQDPVEEFCAFLEQHYPHLRLDEAPVRVDERQRGRRCPSLHTAAQIGLAGMAGIPNILDFMIVRETPRFVKKWFLDLLSVPRPLKTVQIIQEALKVITKLEDSVPPLRTYLSPGGIVKTFEDERLKAKFFRTVHTLLSDVLSLFETEGLRELCEKLLMWVSAEQETHIEAQIFHDHCLKMRNIIESYLVLEEPMPQEETVGAVETPKQALQKFAAKNEEFRGVVLDRHLTTELQRVQQTSAAVTDAVFETLDGLKSLASDDPQVLRNIRCDVDRVSNALYFELPVALMKHPQIGTLGLVHPSWSRTGRKKTSKPRIYSSSALASAISEYRDACAEADAKVLAILKEMKDQLSSKTVIQASLLSTAALSLIQHNFKAQLSQWTLPQITEGRCPLKIQHMWPYWMEREHEETVTNSLELKNMVLLTGPNMTGKSTVLRSITSVVLLALSGLYVPAEAVQCPMFDQTVLRSFSGDNPYDRHSGFSMEMAEMQLAVEHCSDRSLVMIDELGKGTEVKTGAGIAGSLLEFFAGKGSMGIFSTHLHLIKKMPLEMRNVTLMKMNTNVIEPDDEDIPLEAIHEPDRRVTSGFNALSLALQVAWDCRLARHVVQRAVSYEKELIDGKRRRAKAAVVSSPVLAATLVPPPVEETPPSVQIEAPNREENGSRIRALLQDVCTLRGVTDDGNPVKVYYVKPGQHPPPRTAGRSCVYVYRRKTGQHYVGETDDLKGRLVRHQRKTGRGGAPFEAWYACIPRSEGAKSMSRAIERDMIAAMTRDGCLMESVYDSRNKNFGLRS